MAPAGRAAPDLAERLARFSAERLTPPERPIRFDAGETLPCNEIGKMRDWTPAAGRRRAATRLRQPARRRDGRRRISGSHGRWIDKGRRSGRRRAVRPQPAAPRPEAGRPGRLRAMTTEGAPPALSVEGVSFAYGRAQVLESVTFAARAGAFTALLGPNGAGKTTLINLVTRLVEPAAGRIAMDGRDVADRSGAALRRLGVVFQSRALDADLTVAENLAYHGALHGLSRAEALARGADILSRFGLGDRLRNPVRALSGGQQRRVEIARALLHSPTLLLCDEASAGLDIEARAAIVDDAHALAADQGAGVLWATHLVDEIRPDDPVVVLHRGRVRAEGTAADLSAGGDLADAFLAMTRETA